MAKNNPAVLERKALRVDQKRGRFVYLMSLTGEELLRLAGVSRVCRDDGGKLIGYQRAEVRKHVREIADYFEDDDMLLAHPIILSFSSRVKFVSSRGQKTSDGLAAAGMLRIPLPEDPDKKPAWIVDGQQRLDAIIGYRQNEFALPDPKKAKSGSVLPPGTTALPPWTGKKFEDLTPEEKQRLLDRELLVIEMTADHPNEVRDLFIRLQAGTPLTAQEKRDAWPGDFTNFVIRHAGKPGHSLSNPKRFFNLFPRSRGLSVDDGVHYVDGLAETRKFFAGLAMTIMVRESTEVDFVDLKGATINDFYLDNLVLEDGDRAALRVVQVLDLVAQLPGFETLREGRPMSFQWAFHLALMVDSLNEGRYSPAWREDVVGAFLAFKQEVADAQLHYRETHESRPHYERFGRLLSGSGSDTADVIRIRHSFLLAQVYAKIRLIPLDPSAFLIRSKRK